MSVTEGNKGRPLLERGQAWEPVFVERGCRKPGRLLPGARAAVGRGFLQVLQKIRENQFIMFANLP